MFLCRSPTGGPPTRIRSPDDRTVTLPLGNACPAEMAPIGCIACPYLRAGAMVAVAQPVRAPDCGSGGWGFKSPQPPLGVQIAECRVQNLQFHSELCILHSAIDFRLVAQLVEHRSPKPGVAGSSPAGPATTNGRDGVAAFVAPARISLEPPARPLRARAAARRVESCSQGSRVSLITRTSPSPTAPLPHPPPRCRPRPVAP